MSDEPTNNGGAGRDIARSPFVRGNMHEMLRRKHPEQLTPQDELFVLEYLVDLNATQAWIRAGGNPATADKVGPRKIKHGLTGMAIARAQAERAKRVGITAERVLQEQARIAFGDPRAVLNRDGSLKSPHEMNEDDAAMIEGVKTRRIVEVGPDGKMQQAEIQEVKLASKQAALSALMRHLGMNNDKVELTVTTPLAQSLDAAFKRTGRRPTIIDGNAEEVVDGDAQPLSDEERELRYMLGLED